MGREMITPKLVSVRPSKLPAAYESGEKCPKCDATRADFGENEDNSGKNGCKHDFHMFFSGNKMPHKEDNLRHPDYGNITYFEARREALRIMYSNPHGWVYKHQECKPSWSDFSTKPRCPHWYGKELNKYMYAYIARVSEDSKWQIMIHYKFDKNSRDSVIDLAEGTSMLGEYQVDSV